jgi:hypothetical protein
MEMTNFVDLYPEDGEEDALNGLLQLNQVTSSQLAVTQKAVNIEESYGNMCEYNMLNDPEVRASKLVLFLANYVYHSA